MLQSVLRHHSLSGLCSGSDGLRSISSIGCDFSGRDSSFSTRLRGDFLLRLSCLVSIVVCRQFARSVEIPSLQSSLSLMALLLIIFHDAPLAVLVDLDLEFSFPGDNGCSYCHWARETRFSSVAEQGSSPGGVAAVLEARPSSTAVLR